MYRLEMKRLVKTRSTLFLAAAALLFSIFFALFNVFSAYDYSSIDGTAFHGLEAIERRRAAAALCEEYGIVASAGIAKQAIPYCNIVFEDGAELKNDLSAYLQFLYDCNPSSVGGALPDDSFYYEAE